MKATTLDLKLMALDSATKLAEHGATKSSIYEEAQAIYEWLMEDVMMESGDDKVTSLHTVN